MWEGRGGVWGCVHRGKKLVWDRPGAMDCRIGVISVFGFFASSERGTDCRLTVNNAQIARMKVSIIHQASLCADYFCMHTVMISK